MFALLLRGFKSISILESIAMKAEFKGLIKVYVDSKFDQIYNLNRFTEICDLFNIEYAYFTSESIIKENYKIAIGWSRIIKNTEGLIVLHDSLLPKYRGFSPVPTQIRLGDHKFGVTAIYASKEVDQGPVIFQESYIYKGDYPTLLEVYNSLVNIYVNIIEKILTHILAHKMLPCIAQDESKASYSIWYDEEDYFINWKLKSEDILRHINSCGHPFEGSIAYYFGVKIRILTANLYHDKINIVNASPGKIYKIIDGQPIVICGEGFLKITEACDYETNAKIKFTKVKSKLK